MNITTSEFRVQSSDRGWRLHWVMEGLSPSPGGFHVWVPATSLCSDQSAGKRSSKQLHALFPALRRTLERRHVVAVVRDACAVYLKEKTCFGYLGEPEALNPSQP